MEKNKELSERARALRKSMTKEKQNFGKCIFAAASSIFIACARKLIER